MIALLGKRSEFILAIIILLIPFTNFIIKNYFEINFVIIKSLSILFIIHLIIAISLFYLFKLFFKNIQFYYFPILIFLILNVFTLELTNRNEYLFLIFVFLTIFLIVIISIYIKKQKYVLIFFLIYFIFLALISLIKLDYKNVLNLYGLDKNFIEINHDLKINSNKNIYFIIYDQMVSLEKFDKHSKQLTKLENNIRNNFDNYLNSDDFLIIKNNYSNYPKTGLTLGSLFNLDDVIKKNEFQIIFSQNFFPDLIYSPSKNNEFNLLKNLKKINYNFYWFGNRWANCRYSNNTLKYCYNDNYNFLEKNLSYNVLNTFYDNTWFSILASSIAENYTPSNHMPLLNESSLFNCHPNHSTCNFISSIKSKNKLKEKNNFVFIHNLIPHNPYIFDENCNYLENELDIHDNIEYLYKTAYLCSLKDIEETTKFIINMDPNSIIIIASDHGINFHEQSFNKYNEKEKFDRLDRSVITFMYNKSCKKIEYSMNGINNLINYTFNCLQNKNTINYKTNQCFDFSYPDVTGKIYKTDENCF